MNKPVVLRFAPSPTGPLHIGGVRTALYNYLFAKQQKGRLILRIEDTDQNRYLEGAEAHIWESFKWLGISFDEGVEEGGPNGPYRQSERARQGIYRQYASQLVESGHAYYAFDTPEELEEMRNRLKAGGQKLVQYNYAVRPQMKNSLNMPPEEVKARLDAGEPYVIRMKMPRKEEIRFYDEVRQWVVFHSSQLDDKILLKSDGMPTYHLANVVDDYLMGISHVIRGEEWLSSTPLHVMLYRSLGWEDHIPVFVHLPLILNPDGKGKLSKRQAYKLGFPVFPINWQDPQNGELSVGFREAGYLPEALLNYLALLGWNPGTEEEVMSLDRLAELFSLEKINNSATNFDPLKLKWFNQVYLRSKDVEALLPMVKEELKKQELPLPSDEFLAGAIELLRDRVQFPAEFVTAAPYLYAAPEQYDEKTARKRWTPEAKQHIAALLEQLKMLENWDAAAIKATVDTYVETAGIRHGLILAPLRLLLTGQPKGPDMFAMAALLGKQACTARIEQAMNQLPLAA